MVTLRDPTHAERELLDSVQRGGRFPAGRTAVHLHLSDLLPSNRIPSYLRIAARLFAPLEQDGSVRVFPLSNGDIMVVGKDMPEDLVDRLVHRVRALFDHDPLAWSDFTADGEGEDVDPFVSWYAFEVDHDTLEAVCKDLLAAAERRRADLRNAEAPPEPIGPADLDGLVKGLEDLEVSRRLRRQPCITILDRKAHLLFEEMFVGMGEVGAAIAPGRDLFADRWLFQEFSRSLDGALLEALPQTEGLARPRAVSVNLNLESIDTPAFRALRATLGDRRVVVEVQVIDVFTNLGLYHRQRDALRAEGGSLLIDGLSPAMLTAMDLKLLDPDFVKVLWFADLAASRHPRDSEALTTMIDDLGAERVILSRCDGEAAVAWGLDHGIRTFQGRFMDAMLAAVTLQKCPQAALCTRAQCSERRSFMSGKRRRECPHLPGLDMVQSFAAPTRAAPTRAGRGPR